MKGSSPVVKNIESGDAHIDFKDVNYKALPNGIKSNDEYTRRFSIESVHELKGLKATTYFETITHLIKGNVGCGVLGLGMAFKNGGLMFSVVMILVISFLSGYNQFLLINMANDFKRKYNRSSISFGETIGTVFENGPPVFKKLSSLIRKLINFFLIATQLGSCCVYVLFIGQSLEQILNCHGIDISIHILMAVVLPFIWLTALIRHLKYIVPLSTVANVSTLAALTLIMHTSLSNLEPISARKQYGRIEDIPLCLSSMIFAMEGISLTLPLEQNMKNSKQFVGLFGVLNVSLVIIGVLLTSVGFFGYWKFGEDVKPTLTLNLETKDNLLSQAVLVAMMIGILCTYALQFFVPIMIIMPKINYYTAKWPYNSCHIYEYMLRTTLVLFTFVMAEIIPHFDLFCALIGAVGGSCLAFVFCPIADLLIRQKADYGKCYWTLILAVFSLIFGLFIFFFGTAITCKDIYYALYKDLHVKQV